MTNHFTTRDPNLQKLADLVKEIQFGMMTTQDGLHLRSRPMVAPEVDDHGDLWFFTSVESAKVEELEKDNRLNIAFANPKDQKYLSISGTATLVRDPEKSKELWSVAYKAWFPKGLEDSNLALLKVTVDQAEYWDTTSSAMVHFLELAKAAISGEPSQAEGAQHGKINLAR